MTREQFDALVQKLEPASRKHPRLYIARIVGLVALAYAYLALILVGSLVLAVVMLVALVRVPATAKLTLTGCIGFAGTFLAILRGLWVRLAPPTGLELRKEEAPILFNLLEEVGSILKCSRFDKVLITSDMNAAVCQVPRLGIFGWHRNYLLLGLPLMQSLEPEEFKAVLAHEFAHSSRGHGRFGNWLYRVRCTWAQVFQQMAQKRGAFDGALRKFIDWYWPVFNGHAFVLARANEYEADACAARLAGPDAAARALLRLPVSDWLLKEKFWPDIFNRAKAEKEPPSDVMVRQGDAFKIGAPLEESQKCLRLSFSLETSTADTHPCLRDRLRALNRLPEDLDAARLPMPTRSAAEALLGDREAAVALKLSEEWRKNVSAHWAAMHEKAQQLSAELAALENAQALTAAQLWEKASKMIQLRGEKEALPLIDQILSLEPHHPWASFVIGRTRLKAEDASGVDLIEQAMDAQPELIEEGCNLLFGYFSASGQREKIKGLEQRMERFREITALAQRERALISSSDTFREHELTEAQLQTLQDLFASERDIACAAVARKHVQHFGQSPCFVIGLTIKASWWRFRRSSANRKLVQRVLKKAGLPGHYLVFVNEKNRAALWNGIVQVPGAMIYTRA